MLDERIGKIGETDTKVCAVTGQAVSAGMIRYSLGNGYYFRVMPRSQRQVTPDFISEMTSLIPNKKAKKTTIKSEVTDNDS